MLAELATPTPTWYLLLAAVLFAMGTVGLLIRRNPLVMFMCIELMLNAVNLTFVAFARDLGDIGGQTAVLFVMVVAAAEVVVGLGIIVAVMRRKPTATSAAATTRVKKTKACPRTSLSWRAKATNVRFTALSISSMHMNITRTLRRTSTPTAPMVKIIAASTR